MHNVPHADRQTSADTSGVHAAATDAVAAVAVCCLHQIYRKFNE